MRVIGKTEGGFIAEMSDREMRLLCQGVPPKPGQIVRIDAIWDGFHRVSAFRQDLEGIAKGLHDLADRILPPTPVIEGGPPPSIEPAPPVEESA